MRQAIIVSGGRIDDEFVRQVIETTAADCLIAADAGVDFFYRNRMRPDVIVGDFDSAHAEARHYFEGSEGIRIERLDPVKDDTDTESALRLAIRTGAEQITLLGATGSRIDHVLGNIELLGIGLTEGVPVTMLDPCNRIRMVDQGIVIRREEQFGTYVSLLPYTPQVKGLTLRGMKYPLTDHCLKGFCSLGISNEIAEDEGVITFSEGILLVIESKD
ncbi:MAG: thiamine diphosphokinase [Roseburia sp.]|jgi:thiamine pyrophosphokinase|nr:thiamine diphosphokinase [Roseburia sp.]